jgi:hypothetical protein
MMPPRRSRRGAGPSSAAGDGPDSAGTIVTVCPGSSAAAPPFQTTGVAVGAGAGGVGVTSAGARAGASETAVGAGLLGDGREVRDFARRAGSARITSRLETTCSDGDEVRGVVRSRAWGGACVGVAGFPGPQPTTRPRGSRVQLQNVRMNPPNWDELW